jgi:hypothetical protein
MRKKKEKVVGKVKRMPAYQGPQPPPNRLSYFCNYLIFYIPLHVDIVTF